MKEGRLCAVVSGRLGQSLRFDSWYSSKSMPAALAVGDLKAKLPACQSQFDPAPFSSRFFGFQRRELDTWGCLGEGEESCDLGAIGGGEGRA